MEQLLQALIKQQIAMIEQAQEWEERIRGVIHLQLQQAGIQMAASQDLLKQIVQIFQHVKKKKRPASFSCRVQRPSKFG